MNKRWPSVFAAAALAAATFAGVSSAQAGSGAPQIDVSALADGEAIPGRYVVIMEDEPLVATFGQDKVNSKQAKNAAKGLRAGHQKALASAGVANGNVTADFTVALNGFAVKMTEQQATKMASVSGVATVMQDVWRTASTDNSGDFLGLNGDGGPRADGLDGEGVIIGVIDSGIWPEHPSLADDGSYSDLGIVLEDVYDDSDNLITTGCDFGNTAHNAADAPFECNNKLIGARQTIPTYRAAIPTAPSEFDSARDENGHGTHTATTAAGNAEVEASILGIDRGSVTGVAPRARVITYKGLGTLGGFGSDLAFSIDQAVADGVDVINYSIGSSSFAIGPDDVAFLFAANAGVFVATSNGNSGPGPATTGSPASVPWLTSVGASTQDRTFQGSASSPDGWEFFGASVTAGTEVLPLVDAEDAGDNLCNIGALDPTVVAGKIVLCERGAIARVAKGEAVALAGGAGMILFNVNDGQALVTDTHFVPSVHINNSNGLVIKAYIDAAGEDAVAQINGGVLTEAQGSVMAAFSSRGQNRLSSDIIKPDVTAPGVNILAGMTPVPEPGAVAGELFQSISGTSMSSPHVAGLFALMKQAHPEWSPAAAKSALMTTARQDVTKEDGVTPADPFDMGAGHVDPSGSPSAKNSPFNPGLVYDAGLFEYAAYSCGAELGIFGSASCAFLDSIGVPSDASDLNLASIGVGELPGSQTVTRTVTNVSGKTMSVRADVEAPAGYTVDVSPKTLVIKKGKSATFQVTITNVSAPLGEWRHGSLTLNELGEGIQNGAGPGAYSVYSPISVRAVQVGVPDVVAGAGVDGAASFDVDFGYTGDYSAAPHGLSAATVISDNVLQDPDQAFDPADGFSNLHQFVTSGDALLRVAIPPDATEADADLDIFLFGPDGSFVAQSTNGGTDELIDVVLPADGTWSLFVQGWAAPDGDSDYDLYAWTVSATPGGNLSLDSAPTSAALGTSGTVDVSWAGAAAGEWHLGAVSHADGSGLIGLTLVEVDNR